MGKNRILFVVLLSSVIFLNTPRVFGWTITADFELGTIGQKAQGPSGFGQAFSEVFFSNQQVRTGAESASTGFIQGSTGFGESGGIFNFPNPKPTEGSELWVRGYFYFSSPWSWTCNPVVKVLRAAKVETSGGAHLGYISVFSDTNGHITISNEIANLQNFTNVYFDTNAWQSIEMYIKFSATPSNAIVRIWKNGVLVIQQLNAITLISSTDISNSTYIFTYWNGGAPQNQTAYNDDFVLTTDRPSNQDAQGNYMIGGSIGWPPPSPPKNLR